jgi:hypothetical protein
MNKHKLSLVLAALAAVVVLAGGWFLGVQPQLASASSADAQRQTIDATNLKNRAELIRLQKQFANIDGMKTALSKLEQSIPGAADSAAFIRSVNDESSAAGTSISTITVGEAQAYVPPSASTATPGATATATASPSASASATAEPSPAATPSAPMPHTDPAITSGDFSMIPVAVSFNAPSDAQALALTQAVQSGTRLFLVDSIAKSPQNSGTGSSWSLQGYIYVLAPNVATVTTTTAATTG